MPGTQKTLCVNHGIGFLSHQNSPRTSRVPGPVVGAEETGMMQAQFLSSRSPDFWECRLMHKTSPSKVLCDMMWGGTVQDRVRGQEPTVRVLGKLPERGNG